MSGASKIVGREVEQALRELSGFYIHTTGQGRTDYNATVKDIADRAGVTKQTARKYLRILKEAGAAGFYYDKVRGLPRCEFWMAYNNRLAAPLPGTFSENL